MPLPARCCNWPALNDPYFDVFALGNLGELLVHAGELDEAGSLLQQALAKANDGGYRAIAPRVECSIGEWLLARGEFAEANRLLHGLLVSESLPIATQLRAYYALYLVHRSEGRCHCRVGRSGIVPSPRKPALDAAIA